MYALVDVPSLTIRKYSLNDYKAGSQNWDLAISPGGILYAANNTGLLTFDGNNWITYKLPDKSAVLRVELSGDTIYTLGENSVGYWLPHGVAGLLYYPLQDVPEHIPFRELPSCAVEAPYPLPDEIRQHKLTAFASVHDLNFTGTLGQGVYITDSEGNILLHLTTKEGLQDNIVYGFHACNSRVLWIAFDNGLAKMTIDSSLEFLVHRAEAGKLTDAVIWHDILYIKTVTSYCKQKLKIQDSFIPVSEEEALPVFAHKKDAEEFGVEEIIKSPEKQGEIEKNSRVYKVSDSLYWFVDKNETKLLYVYGDSIGLKGRIRLDNYNANVVYREKQVIPLNDSLHAVSTVEGVFLININRLARNANDKGAPFRFTKIEYKTPEEIHPVSTGTKKLSLPYNFSEIVFHVGSSVFNFNNQISYRIDKISHGWSDWQKDGRIRFLQLPKGNYTLRVRKYVFQGDFPEITFPFEVRPPWYKSIWASLCFFMLFFVILYVATLTYIRSQQKKEQIRLELEYRTEQQKLQEMQNELLEAELQNKKNELMKQTATLARKSTIVNKLLDEINEQKKTLGERYPNKLYQRMRSLIEEIANDQGDWQAFESYFNSAHQNFIDRFRMTYSDITTGDLRLSCLLRMNLSTKEIASSLNISVRAVELRRYRLRKRIGLASDQNLTDFLINF